MQIILLHPIIVEFRASSKLAARNARIGCAQAHCVESAVSPAKT